MSKVKSRLIFLICFILIWQVIYNTKIFPELLFPSIKNIFTSLVTGINEEGLLVKTFNSLKIIFTGISLGIIVSILLMGVSLTNKFFYNLVDNFVLFLNPIPSMAIFPLCILWFGIGKNAMIAIMLHTVVWGLLVNILSGINSLPKIYKELGLNLELSKFQMFKDIYIPACMPYIISGLKNALSRAWRTAISVEMLAGIMTNNAGLGWLMNYQRNTLNISGLFSTIVIIVMVGILLNDVFFKTLEKFTLEKWGMVQ